MTTARRSAAPAATDEVDAAAREALRLRYEQLKTRKDRAEFERDAAQRRLEELAEEARRQWGTDDPQALRERLEEMKAENERQRLAYEQALDGFERELAAVDEAWNSTDS